MAADMKRLINALIVLRSKKEALAEKQKQEMELITSKMDTIELAIRKAALDAGVDSFKTEVGTATLVQNMKVSCEDWIVFRDFLKDKDPLTFLGKRISVTSIRDFMDANDGAVPPGVKTFREASLRITAAK